MFSFLVVLLQAADIAISPLVGLSKIEKVTLDRGEKITYTASSRTVIYYKDSNYLRQTITPDTTEKGKEYAILSRGSVFEAECILGSKHDFSFMISKIPNNSNKIIFIDGNLIELSISAYDFNESDPSCVQPRVYINTVAATFNYNFLNPIPIGDFKIYNSSLDDPIMVIGSGISNGEIVSSSGFIIEFIPNNGFGELLKMNMIGSKAYPKYINNNLAKFSLSDKKNNNESPTYLVSLPSFLDCTSLYATGITYAKFVETMEMIGFNKWRDITSDDNHFPWKGISGSIEDGHKFSLRSANIDYENRFSDVSFFESIYYYQYYFQSVSDFLNSSCGEYQKSLSRSYKSAIEGFVNTFSPDSIIPTEYVNILLNSSAYSYIEYCQIYNKSVDSICKLIVIDHDEFWENKYLNISEFIETMSDSIDFWLEVLGLNNNNTKELIKRLHYFPNQVYFPEVFSSLHIEFKYILRIIKAIDNMVSQKKSQYSTVFGSLPIDISPHINSINTVFRNLILSGKIDLNSIDVAFEEVYRVLVDLFQSSIHLTLDISNCILKFVKHVMNSNTSGDFMTRFNKFLNEKSQLLPIHYKGFLERFSINEGNLEALIFQINPNIGFGEIIGVITSVFKNESIKNIIKALFVDKIEFYELIDYGFSRFGDVSTKMNDAIEYIENLTDASPQYLVNIVHELISSLNNKSFSIDQLFYHEDYYYNYQNYTDLAEVIRVIASNIEEKITAFKGGYSIIEMIELSKVLFEQKTLRGFLHEVMHISEVSYTTDSLIDMLFSTIRFIARRQDKLLSMIPIDLKTFFKPIIDTVFNINSYVNNNDIQISDLIKCFCVNGDQLVKLFNDFTSELSTSYNLSLALKRIPSSFIDFAGTLNKLQSLTVASFLNIYDCIVVNKVEGKINCFDVIPIDRIHNSLINIYDIMMKRDVLLSDLSQNFIFIDKLMTISSYIKELWTNKLCPLEFLSMLTSIDFGKLFNASLELCNSIQANKLGPTSLAKFVTQSTEFLDTIAQDSSVTPIPKKKNTNIMLFIGLGSGLVVILVLFLVFKPKKLDQETETTFGRTLV